MGKFMIEECVKHYHEVTIDEELDIESIIKKANQCKHRFDTGHEAIRSILEEYSQQYGFNYEVKPNSCGTDCIEINVIDELD